MRPLSKQLTEGRSDSSPALARSPPRTHAHTGEAGWQLGERCGRRGSLACRRRQGVLRRE
eukprot:133213-Rhodomonas_salina.2